TFSFPNFNDDLKAFGIDFNHVFGQQIPVRLKTEEKFIDVKAIPADYSAKNWLPVTNLDLSASWSARNGFKVGEAVSRNIFLKASGMTESMLPQISFKDGSGFRQYPEKPEITEEVINGEVVTTAKYNNVYIPTESGNITIPEIKIDWFDVKENEHKIATIPEETILVLPNPVLEQNKVKDNNKELSLPLSNTNKESVQTEEPLIAPDIQKTSGDLFASFISMFYSYLPFVLIFLLFVFLFIALVIKSKKSHKNRNAIISALRKHDYKKAKDALLFWAKDKYYPADINNFNDISNIVKDADFTEQLSALNKFLYSTEADFFDSSKFISVLKKIDKIKRKEHKKSEVLPNLYD
ncbi:MAG: BatD family protein, partial [Alphaproteobacteria bacterium]|nr:BatD family protein [Alphaproteobacteria bacterium]